MLDYSKSIAQNQHCIPLPWLVFSTSHSLLSLFTGVFELHFQTENKMKITLVTWLAARPNACFLHIAAAWHPVFWMLRDGNQSIYLCCYIVGLHFTARSIPIDFVCINRWPAFVFYLFFTVIILIFFGITMAHSIHTPRQPYQSWDGAFYVFNALYLLLLLFPSPQSFSFSNLPMF